MKRRNFVYRSVAAILAHILWSCGWEKSPQEVASGTPGAPLDPCKITTRDNLGAFYRKNAPMNNEFDLKNKDTFLLKGKIYRENCTDPIAAAHIEIWQADEAGTYDMETNRFANRTTILSDEHGYYEIETFLPGHYSTRPQHIHYIVGAEGYQELITQVYFQDDPKARKLAADYPHEYAGRLLEMQDNGGKFASFDIHLQKKK